MEKISEDTKHNIWQTSSITLAHPVRIIIFIAERAYLPSSCHPRNQDMTFLRHPDLP